MIELEKLTFEYLSECFLMEEETGVLYWRERPAKHFISERHAKGWNRSFAGKKAGYIKRRLVQPDYWYLKLGERHILLHRAVWALSRKVDLREVPPMIDHIDCDSLKNRPDNLREVSAQQSCQNRRLRLRSKYGVIGVKFDKRSGAWTSRIVLTGKPIHLGSFNTKEEAAAAYLGAAKIAHGEYYREPHTQAAA